MPQDDDSGPKTNVASLKATKSPWLTTPKPIKRLFDRFPLVTYPANELPKRKSIDRTRNRLYIFARDEESDNGSPSFNPSCLKWQTYLKILNVDFITIPSTNHASPTGALPFLITASSSSNPESSSLPPVPATKLEEWATRNGSPTSGNHTSEDMRYEAYMSLLDHRIRNAWLHTLYLHPSNYNAVARPLYIEPATSSSLVHRSLTRTLQSAALQEVVTASQSPVVDLEALYRESHNAFAALSELLGDDQWFFGEAHPGLMDASVFAYTHLLLDTAMGWDEEKERMGMELREGGWRNLVEHRRRVYGTCYQ